jgi:hypothetical protein
VKLMATPSIPIKARRQLREELQHLRTRQRLAPLDYPVLMHAVHLKDLFRNVQPAASKLHRDCPCYVIERTTVFNLAQPMP